MCSALTSAATEPIELFKNDSMIVFRQNTYSLRVYCVLISSWFCKARSFQSETNVLNSHEQLMVAPISVQVDLIFLATNSTSEKNKQWPELLLSRSKNIHEMRGKQGTCTKYDYSQEYLLQ